MELKTITKNDILLIKKLLHRGTYKDLQAVIEYLQPIKKYNKTDIDLITKEIERWLLT